MYAFITPRRIKKAAETDDFEAKLAEAGVNENGEANGEATGEADKAAPEEEVVEGDMVLGTGIWALRTSTQRTSRSSIEWLEKLRHSTTTVSPRRE